MFDTLAISGIPLVVVVFGLVEMLKAFGLKGNLLTWSSLGLGILLYLAYSFADGGLPVDFAGWLNVVVVGLMFGLTASGIYSFANERFPRVKKE